MEAAGMRYLSLGSVVVAPEGSLRNRYPGTTGALDPQVRWY